MIHLSLNHQQNLSLNEVTVGCLFRFVVVGSVEAFMSVYVQNLYACVNNPRFRGRHNNIIKVLLYTLAVQCCHKRTQGKQFCLFRSMYNAITTIGSHGLIVKSMEMPTRSISENFSIGTFPINTIQSFAIKFLYCSLAQLTTSSTSDRRNFLPAILLRRPTPQASLANTDTI